MKKILFVMVLIFCLLGTTQTAYSYFENDKVTVLNESNELYKINESSSSQNMKLIPLGSVLGVNDTYYLTYQYTIYVEKDVKVESIIENLSLENSKLTELELKSIFNFEIIIDHVKDIQLSNGLFTNQTNGELLQITVEITMNDSQDLHILSTNDSHNLSFTYLLTVSK